MDGDDGGVKTQPATSHANRKDEDIDSRQDHLFPATPIQTVVHEQPEDRRHAVSEVRREESRDERKQVVEVGDALGDDPSDGPQRGGDDEPSARSFPGALGEVRGAAEHADEDVFAGDVAVDDAGDDDLVCLCQRGRKKI